MSCIKCVESAPSAAAADDDDDERRCRFCECRCHISI